MTDDSRTHFMSEYVAHQGRVYRYILTLVPNPADAEELFQQTSMTLWQKWDEFDPGRGVFPQWAFGIAHNHVRNFLRKTGRRGATMVLSEQAIERIAALRREHDDVLEERREALTRCMQSLPDRSRRIVQTYYDGADQPVDAMAVELRMTRQAFYKALQRVRRALMDCINGRLGEEAAR